MEKLTLSVSEMAQQLGVSKPTAYKLANSKGFPVLLIGERKVIPVDGLKRWMNQNTGQRGRAK